VNKLRAEPVGDVSKLVPLAMQLRYWHEHDMQSPKAAEVLLAAASGV